MGRQAALIPPFSLRRRPFPNGRAVWAKSELFAASPALFPPAACQNELLLWGERLC